MSGNRSPQPNDRPGTTGDFCDHYPDGRKYDVPRTGESSIVHRLSSGLPARWLSALVGIPLFLGIAWWGPVPFGIGVFILAAIGLGEMFVTYRKHGFHPNPFLALLGLIVVLWPLATVRGEPATSGLQAGFLALVMVAMLAAAPVWEVARAVRTGELSAARNLGLGAVCGGYVALFACLTGLRMLYDVAPKPGYSEGSYLWQPLFVTMFSVWATDSFAFFVGKAFGKHKLAPLISPGKTVEGAIGGLTAALITGAAFGAWLLSSWQAGMAIGAISGVVGQIGDLFKSTLKREVGVKDFGGILPGHGGVLDRFDSLLFVAPMVLLMYLLEQ